MLANAATSYTFCWSRVPLQVLRSNYINLGCVAYTSVEHFALWYADTTPAVGKTLPFTEDGSGNFVYDSSQYFPLNGIGCKDYGNYLTQYNFAFTSEVTLWFKYEGKETFDFRGDDDVW